MKHNAKYDARDEDILHCLSSERLNRNCSTLDSFSTFFVLAHELVASWFVGLSWVLRVKEQIQSKSHHILCVGIRAWRAYKRHSSVDWLETIDANKRTSERRNWWKLLNIIAIQIVKSWKLKREDRPKNDLLNFFGDFSVIILKWWMILRNIRAMDFTPSNFFFSFFSLQIFMVSFS